MSDRSEAVREGRRKRALESIGIGAFIIGTAMAPGTLVGSVRPILGHDVAPGVPLVGWGCVPYVSVWLVGQVTLLTKSFTQSLILYTHSFSGTGAVTMSVYVSLNVLLMVLDLTTWPKALYKYKVQPQQIPSWARLRKAIVVVAFNQTIVAYPVMTVFYYLNTWRGSDFGAHLPTVPQVVIELLVCTLVEEIGFYYTHRLAHHPRLYKHVHKIHHEWTAPTGIVSLYCHPLEHVISNLTPPMLGPLICGSHVTTAWLWYTLAIISSTLTHSGYHFPLMVSPESHDYHHLKFNQNFGVLGVLDRLHGTDSQFRQSNQYKRHLLLTSTTPLLQSIPDNDKKSE